jgi:hypothetical protein
MAAKKSSVKLKKQKTNLSFAEISKMHPEFEDNIARLAKEFSESVQGLMVGTEIEAIVRVSFSFNSTEGEK